MEVSFFLLSFFVSVLEKHDNIQAQADGGCRSIDRESASRRAQSERRRANELIGWSACPCPHGSEDTPLQPDWGGRENRNHSFFPSKHNVPQVARMSTVNP
jgi:hypothetical protein